MRSLFALVLLTACSQPPPQAELAGAPSLGEMTYICSETNEEAVMFTDANGDLVDLRSTGRPCDYEAWRADVDAEGPITTRRSPSPYQDWLRAHPEA